jgi:hypothetical protein
MTVSGIICVYVKILLKYRKKNLIHVFTPHNTQWKKESISSNIPFHLIYLMNMNITSLFRTEYIIVSTANCILLQHETEIPYQG